MNPAIKSREAILRNLPCLLRRKHRPPGPIRSGHGQRLFLRSSGLFGLSFKVQRCFKGNGA